jgi:hypothetical protein
MKRPHLPHLILNLTSSKTKAETDSPVSQGESQHTSLKERTIKLGRKLSLIARPTPKQAHQLQTQSDDSQLEQVQEESVDSMGPLREMELVNFPLTPYNIPLFIPSPAYRPFYFPLIIPAWAIPQQESLRHSRPL